MYGVSPSTFLCWWKSFEMERIQPPFCKWGKTMRDMPVISPIGRAGNRYLFLVSLWLLHQSTTGPKRSYVFRACQFQKHIWWVSLLCCFISTISRSLAFCWDQQRDFKYFSLMLPRWEYSGHALKHRILQKNTYFTWKKPYIYIHTGEDSSSCINFTNGNNFCRLRQKHIVWESKKIEIYFYF